MFSWRDISVVGTATGSNVYMHSCTSACIPSRTRFLFGPKVVYSLGMAQIQPTFDVVLLGDGCLNLLVRWVRPLFHKQAVIHVHARFTRSLPPGSCFVNTRISAPPSSQVLSTGRELSRTTNVVLPSSRSRFSRTVSVAVRVLLGK